MSRFTVTRMALLVSISLALGACAMVPPLPPAQADLPNASRWVDLGGAADAAASHALPRWSDYFTDPRLQGLIRQALDNNRDLRSAWLQTTQARALLTTQRADLFPTVQAGVNATRQPATAAPNAPTTTATAGLSMTAFELDVWGRVRALTESAQADWQASVSTYRAVQITLMATVAQAYYSLWADQWQLALAQSTLDTRADARRLQQMRYDGGVINEADWQAVMAQYEAARVSQLQAERQYQQSLNAMAVLLGQPVPANALPPMPFVPSVPTSPTASALTSDALPPLAVLSQASLWPVLGSIPVGLPSEVLLRRPDVMAAEQQLVAANADIGAARAARFPRLSLTTSAGVVSDALSTLFSGGREAWSVGGSLAAPLLDAGRSAAQVDIAQARRDAALAQYEKALQVAFKEVADALVARRTWDAQVQAQQAQAQAETARLKLAQLRYQNGVANAIEWLDAQRSLFASQQALIAAQLARQQAHIAAFKALGGGLE